MKKFIFKVVLITLITFTPIVICNYFVDPANIFHDDVVNKVAEYLNGGYIVEVPANMDEGLLQEKRISAMTHTPKTVVIGSSRVMYIPFDYEDTYNAGMSGAYLGDYYSIVGLLKYYDKMPERIVIGVDPWAFLRDATDGRHIAIKKYAIKLKEDLQSRDSDDEKGHNILGDKLKELLSFAYFQSSVKDLRANGVRDATGDVVRVEDSSIGDKQKILSDGRRVPAKQGFQTANDIEKKATEYTQAGNIYQLGTGFTEIPVERLNDFDTLLKYLVNNRIKVELYLPSWHPKVYNYFITHKEFAGVKKVEDEVRKLGEKYNITVHGGYNPLTNNFSSNDFMDWLHLQPNKMYEDYKYVNNDIVP